MVGIIRGEEQGGTHTSPAFIFNLVSIRLQKDLHKNMKPAGVALEEEHKKKKKNEMNHITIERKENHIELLLLGKKINK